jgi:hypothetical protein
MFEAAFVGDRARHIHPAKGQREAARHWHEWVSEMRYIVMPQAMRSRPTHGKSIHQLDQRQPDHIADFGAGIDA